MECSDSGQAGAVAVTCRRSDLDDGVVGSRCVGTEAATKVLSSGRNCVCDAIGRIGGDVVAVSWSLSRKSVGLRCSSGDYFFCRPPPYRNMVQS